MIELKFNELQWIMDKEGGIGPISPLFGEKFPLEGDEETILTGRGILENGELKKDYYADIIPLLDPDKVARVVYEMPTIVYNVSTLSHGEIKRIAVRDFEGVTIYSMEALSDILISMAKSLIYPKSDRLSSIIKLDSFDFLCFLEALDITRKNLLLMVVGDDLDCQKLLPLTAEKVLEKLQRPIEEASVIKQMVGRAFPDSFRGWPEDLETSVAKSMEKLLGFGILEKEEEGYIPSLDMQDYADCFSQLSGILHAEYAHLEEKKIILSDTLVFMGRCGSMAIIEGEGKMAMMGIEASEILTMVKDYLNLSPLEKEASKEEMEEAMLENEKIRKKRREKIAKMAEESKLEEKSKAEDKLEEKSTPKPDPKGEEGPAQKFCPQCGKPYKPGTKFCSKCGKQLS